MKSLFLILYLLNAQVQNNGTGQHSTAAVSNGHSLKIVFHNHIAQCTHSDSVLVILDKFDHTGAGVIRKIYSAGQDHTVNIEGVPEGKYYATFQFLGFHSDKIEQVIHISAKKANTVKCRLTDADEFSKENVEMPADKFDFAHLAVAKSR